MNVKKLTQNGTLKNDHNGKFYVIYALPSFYRDGEKKFVVVTWEIDWKGEENNQGMHLR